MKKIISEIIKKNRDDLHTIHDSIKEIKQNNIDISNFALFDKFLAFKEVKFTKQEIFRELMKYNPKNKIEILELLVNFQLENLKIFERLKQSNAVLGDPTNLNYMNKYNKTFDEIKHIISTAKKKILIFGYDYTGVKEINELLVQAARKRIKLLIFGQPQFVIRLVSYLKKYKILAHFEIYQFEKQEKAPRSQKLHAKVIVKDDTEGLVTSSNLTYSGLSCNIEIGMKIGKSEAEEINKFANELIDSGLVHRYRVFN